MSASNNPSINQWPITLGIPRNMHTVLLCFALLWLCVRLPQCQWSKPDGYGKISQCITTTKHSKAKTVCIFLRIYYNVHSWEDRYNTGTILSVLTRVGMHHYVIYHDIISRGSVCITYYISMPVHDWWRTEDAEKSSISYWIKKTVGISADAKSRPIMPIYPSGAMRYLWL